MGPFAALLDHRFDANPSIHVHCEGVGRETREETIFLQGDASTTTHGGRTPDAESVVVRIRRITDVIDALSVRQVDLLKLNIEGGEYEVLDCLLKAGYLERITNLQVQFRSFSDDSERRRNAIQDLLRSTHTSVTAFPLSGRAGHGVHR